MKMEVCGIEHLHRHSDYSLLDGHAQVFEYAERSQAVNQQFLCITDHGQMGCIPKQIAACDKYNLTPIFGCELYVSQMQEACTSQLELDQFIKNLSEEDKPRWRKNYHLLALAYTDTGYKNLVKLATWGYSHGYGGLPRRPRVNHETLLRHKEGIIFTSCCYMSEIGQAFDRGGEDAGFAMIEKYKAMFGDAFYLEIMLLDFNKQKPYNAFIIKAHEKYHIPIFLSQDCHYASQADSKHQRYMLMVRTDNTLKDIEEAIKKDGDTDQFFELQDTNLWMKSEDEINQKWLSDYREIVPYEIFCQAKRESVKIANRAKGVNIDRSIKLPHLPDADEKFKEALLRGYKWRGLSGDKYASRLKEEYELICRKGFASYFLIEKQAVDEVRNRFGDDAIGCGRGSAVGSLACYCLGITDVDPIHHDLLFSRFISEARGGKQLKLRFNQNG